MGFRRKALIIVQNLPVPLDRRVWLEAGTLRDAGYSVSVICPRGSRQSTRRTHELLDGVHIYRYPAPPEALSALDYVLEFAYCWLMAAVLSLWIWYRHGFHVIHACNPPETYFLLAFLYRFVGKRFLFDHHDLSPELYLAKGGRKGGFFHRQLLWLERRTLLSAEVVTTANESQRAVAVRRGGISPRRIHVVRSGPDLEKLRILEPEHRLKGGLDFLACYLGEMNSQDRGDLLLEIARRLTRDRGRPDVRFVLMGGGDALGRLKRLRATMGLDDVVEFTGRVMDDDICRYLSTADVCLVPDPRTEYSDKSSMNKVVEYMAFGKPIVAFDLTENRFSAGEAAVYATPNDVGDFARKISALLDDPERREKMGGAGLHRVRTRLSWDYSVPHLLEAYEELFGRPR